MLGFSGLTACKSTKLRRVYVVNSCESWGMNPGSLAPASVPLTMTLYSRSYLSGLTQFCKNLLITFKNIAFSSLLLVKNYVGSKIVV